MISCLVRPVVPSSSMLRVVRMETGENKALPVPSSLTALSTIDMVRFQMEAEALIIIIKECDTTMWSPEGWWRLWSCGLRLTKSVPHTKAPVQVPKPEERL